MNNETVFSYLNYSTQTQRVKNYWKIHISCEIEEFISVIKSVARVCKHWRVSYKFPKSEFSLKYLLGDKSSEWLYGKVITIYLSKEDFKKCGDQVNKKLLLRNILIIGFGYYFFDNIRNSYQKQLLSLKLALLKIKDKSLQKNHDYFKY